MRIPFLSLCSLVIGSALILYGCVHTPATLTDDATAPAALHGWTLTLPENQNDAQAATFEGAHGLGVPLFVPSGAALELQTEPSRMGLLISVSPAWCAQGGRELAHGASRVALRAPKQPGLFTLRWRHPALTPNAGELRVLVLQRAAAHTMSGKDGVNHTRLSVNGNAIGVYLDPTSSGIENIREHAERYAPPTHFTTLDRAQLDLAVGDGLKLSGLVAFMDHRDPNGKKVFTTERHTDVLPVNRALCQKLMLLRERLCAQGVKLTRFWITSGFRTPDYNRKIGGAAFSRHCYGDAVDLCIDENGDRHMDDLNGDERLDRLDGRVIALACAALEAEGLAEPGGIGVYEWDGEDSVRSHVHIDCRGYTARWGQSTHGKKKNGYRWWSDADGKDTPLPSDGE